MRSIFVVYEFKSDLKKILDLLCSLYEKKVSQCVISDQICSHFLRGDVYLYPFFFGTSNCKIRRLFAKKGDYSHQTSKKINAIQYNEKSDLFRSCLFSLLLRIWGGFFAENSSIPQPHVRQLICFLGFYKIILQTSTYLAHRIQQPIYTVVIR